MIVLEGIEYLSLAEAGRLIEYNPQSLRPKVASGEIKGIRVGKTWYTREVWLHEWMRKGSNFQEGADQE